MSYKALVCKLTNLRNHENADNLQVATISGYSVIVSKDYYLGDVGVLFPPDGALTKEVCSYHNLYRHKELNKDTTKVGYFNDNGSVHAIKLRGEKSEGLFVKLDFLAPFIDVSNLKPGDIIEDQRICGKHYTKAESMRLKNVKKDKSTKPNKFQYFKKHFDTEQLRLYVNSIPEGSIIYISEKQHGTSGITARLQKSITLGRIQKFFCNLLKITPKLYEWDYVSSSRNVILNNSGNDGYYKDSSFRKEIHNRLKTIGLRKGETIYYEICGYTDNKKLIMCSHNVGKIKDKEHKKLIQSKYGDTIEYKYGASLDGKLYDIFVYRITVTDDNGFVYELPWEQVHNRCQELGVNPITVLTKFIYDGNKEALLNKAISLSDGSSIVDPSHIREGVCVRYESPGKTGILKLKGFTFSILEGILKQDDNFVDIEAVE